MLGEGKDIIGGGWVELEGVGMGLSDEILY